VRNSLILIIVLLICGCSSSLSPTYIQANIDQSIENICKKEYKLDVKVKLIGSTLWVYLPVEDLFVKNDKPEKVVEKFDTFIQNMPDERSLKFAYLVKPIPDRESMQQLKYNKSVLDKSNDAWKALRRVIFSLDRSKTSEPKFYYLVIADIKNGEVLTEINYYLDLKKVSYEYISWNEYQHRTLVKRGKIPSGDKEGKSIYYRDITMKEFIADQIVNRLDLKFQKPEVDKNVDIDKEVRKVIAHTLEIYGFKDFDTAELNNLLTKNRIVLSREAAREKSID
jgi:hypothetical protein